MPPEDEDRVREDRINRARQMAIEEIQAHEDAYILAAMGRAPTAAEVYRVAAGGEVTITLPPLTPGQVVRIRGMCQEMGRVISISTPNPTRRRDIMYLDQQSWDDIVHVGGPPLEGALQAQIALETSRPRADLVTWPAGYVLGHAERRPPEFIEASYVQEPTDPATRIGFMVHEQLGAAVINPRGIQRLQIPEFELASNPTIRLDDVRRRRFDLIDRTPQDPHVWKLLDALLRAKIQKSDVPIRPPGASRTMWEALLELDLVDAEPGPESRH